MYTVSLEARPDKKFKAIKDAFAYARAYFGGRIPCKSDWVDSQDSNSTYRAIYLYPRRNDDYSSGIIIDEKTREVSQ
jgi:hypothetical protein